MMVARRLLPLSAVLAWLAMAPFAGPASAAETMYEGDSDRALKEDVEETYGVYILNPSRRRPEEKVQVRGDTVEMWLFVDPRKPDYDRMKCDGLKWTLIGRFGKGGAEAFFKRHTKLNNVDLVVYRLDSKRTVDANGNYTITKTPQKYMQFRVSRKTADKLDWKVVRNALDKTERTDKEVAACVRTGQRFVRHWYSKEYFK